MIVLDCDAAIAMAMGTPTGRALRTLTLDGEEIIAPRLLSVEAAHVIAKYVLAKSLAKTDSATVLSSVVSLVDMFHDDDDLATEAMAEGLRLGHSTYDMMYFVLARRHAATLFTLDKKLQKLCLDNGIECVSSDTEF